MFVSGDKTSDHLRVLVDDDYAQAWRSGEGRAFVEHFRKQGYHVIVCTKDQINFIVGHGRDKPAKLMLDWVL